MALLDLGMANQSPGQAMFEEQFFPVGILTSNHRYSVHFHHHKVLMAHLPRHRHSALECNLVCRARLVHSNYQCRYRTLHLDQFVHYRRREEGLPLLEKLSNAE